MEIKSYFLLRAMLEEKVNVHLLGRQQMFAGPDVTGLARMTE